MAYSYKVLGQSLPAANTYTDIYTVPVNNSAIVSSLNVCNLSANIVTFRAAIRTANATLTNKHFVCFDSNVSALDTLSLSLGMTLGNTDVVTVFSNVGGLSFNVFGTEIS